MDLSPAESLLQSLGVSEACEIDLEAIAFHVDARVRHRDLDGCDACIVGHSDKAIITVKRGGNLQRQRFSIAHELGHWHHHRGQRLACSVDATAPEGDRSEWEANRYAADLLMPWYLFKPMAKSLKRVGFKEIGGLAKAFNTSKTATVIRLVESGVFPSVVLVCHQHEGRKWFKRGSNVSNSWFPKKQLDPDSYAMDVQFGAEAGDQKLRRVKASAWFDQKGSGRFEVQETTIQVGDRETLTILLLPDEMTTMSHS